MSQFVLLTVIVVVNKIQNSAYKHSEVKIPAKDAQIKSVTDQKSHF